MLCIWWICALSVSMRAHDLHCARPCANITKNLIFLIRHSMHEALRIKLQFVLEHSYILRFTGVAISEFIPEWSHFCQSILIMVQSYVYTYDFFPFSDNLPNALHCSTLI